MALTSALSPFFGVTFPVIWMTDQLVSLTNPFKDFAKEQQKCEQQKITVFCQISCPMAAVCSL